ncbi:methyl-accepting chemotaxis protein [Salimicrobium halophilum]|uniref:Methyl-accepting chemotaxis sensory transducer with Cache sensor n=1 Tax=Salimicrobium halophilum TaxID=86666 RepID=A0A1G8SXS1_9BACI|nr:methyl-accepting chemotaxis protein [Salimicrobium halophilum]SDJ34047.1 methyl-accepting chemotaxis sensory transducer with Cache sensor [Salimicrobium halophilum]
MFTSIRGKIIALTLLILIIPVAIIGFTSYETSKAHMDELGETNLKNNVKTTISLIESLQNSVQEGAMTETQAKEEAKEIMLGEMQGDGTRPIDTNVDLGENGYPFVMNENGDLLAHPSLEGDNLMGVEDENGNDVGQIIVDGALEGDGFSKYSWALPGNPDQSAPKIIYAEQESEWGWIVASGSYMMDFNSGANQVLTMQLIIGALAIIIGGGAIWIFSGKLTRPIRTLSERSRELADGDFREEDLPVTSRDEIGDLTMHFNQMKQSLVGLVQSIQRSSEQVAAASEELHANSEENAQAAEQVAVAIQEVAAGADTQLNHTQESTEGMTMIAEEMKQFQTDMNKLSESSRETADVSKKGEASIEEALKQMVMIQEHSGTTTETMQHLDEKSREIGKIISIITDISDQTNLLALNAAIEAARAGEHGKGFAVVAEEVRKLAEQSNHSAKDILGLVEDMQAQTKEAVQSTEEGNKAITSGVETVEEAKESFQKITDDIETIAGNMQEMTTSIDVLTSRTSDIQESFQTVHSVSEAAAGQSQNVASISEEQTASVEEISSTSETLAGEANKLQEQAARFKI